jgi:hypothetical protein
MAPVTTETAAAFALAKVAAVRDDPARRLALLGELYEGGPGERDRLPYRRAAIAFMSWQLRRDLLNPSTAAAPGSPWWRACNERLVRDGWEARALVSGHGGGEPSTGVSAALDFIALDGHVPAYAWSPDDSAPWRPARVSMLARAARRAVPGGS